MKTSRRIETETQRENLLSFFAKCPLGEHGLMVTWQPYEQVRTAKQNSMLWAGAYSPIAEHLSLEHGRIITSEHVHAVCKSKFLEHETNPINGKVYPGSTRKLSKKEFGDYLEQVWAWGNELGVFFDTMEAA